MSNYTLGNLSYISRDKLASLIKAKTPGLSVIDVRDSDYIGGHIINSQNIPTQTFDYRMPELVRTLKDQDTIVFHCALSQQRGPSSALRYLRERQRMYQKGELGVRKDGRDLVEGQEVLVLDGGFSKWQESYGEDAELTEAYVKDLWKDNW